MFTNLFFAVVVGFCLGYLFRAFVVPAYKNYEREKEREEMEAINNHDQYVQKVNRFLKRIENLVVEFYGSQNVIRKKHMPDLIENASYLAKSYNFNEVKFDWIGNSETYVLDVTIDGVEYRLWGRWDISVFPGDDKSDLYPNFIPKVNFPK